MSRLAVLYLFCSWGGGGASCSTNTFIPSLIYLFVIENTGFSLQPETQLHLTSHNYPSQYPPDAYVIWTFQLASATDDDIVYHISYGYVSIHYGDYLKIGYGWDSTENISVIVWYHGYYYGYPLDTVISSRYIYIEFEANSRYESSGFSLSLLAQNSSGTLKPSYRAFHLISY